MFPSTKSSPVTEELRMVKRIERLEPEFERFRLRQPGELAECNVVVGHPRRIKEPPRRGARSPECVGTEQRGIEIGLAVASRPTTSVVNAL